MPHRKRWVLELHIQESHPDASVESVLGPSNLSTSSGSKRRSSRREKLTQRRLCVASNQPAKEMPSSGDSAVMQPNIVEQISDEDEENSLLSTLNRVQNVENKEDDQDPSLTHLKLQSKQCDRPISDVYNKENM